MVRRLKEDIRAVGVAGFPQREVIQVDIDGLPDDAPEWTLMTLLDKLVVAWDIAPHMGEKEITSLKKLREFVRNEDSRKKRPRREKPRDNCPFLTYPHRLAGG